MKHKFWIYKGLSILAAICSVICCIYHKVGLVFGFAVLAILFSVIGDRNKKNEE